MAGLLGDSKGPIEGARDFHGKRPEHRRTMGNPARSAFFLYAFGLRSDFERLGHVQLARAIEEAIDFAANSWAGHDGWDTMRSIDMVEAATQTRLNPMVNGNAPDDAP